MPRRGGERGQAPRRLQRRGRRAEPWRESVSHWSGGRAGPPGGGSPGCTRLRAGWPRCCPARPESNAGRRPLRAWALRERRGLPPPHSLGVAASPALTRARAGAARGTAGKAEGTLRSPRRGDQCPLRNLRPFLPGDELGGGSLPSPALGRRRSQREVTSRAQTAGSTGEPALNLGLRRLFGANGAHPSIVRRH